MKTKLCLLAMPIIFAACGNKGQNATQPETTDSVTTDSTVYAGQVPAAANDSTHGFRLTSTYTVGKEGEKQTFQENGNLELIEKEIDGKKLEFYKLKLGKDAGELILKKVDDNTLRLVNDEFKEAESKLNYDLKKK